MNEITYTERKAIYDNAIDTYGTQMQTLVAIEEMSELQKELCKYHRGKSCMFDIAEEIADVTIMLEQLRIIFDCNDEVCRQMDYKVGRLAHRIVEDRT